MTLADAMRRQYSGAKVFWRFYLALELLRLAVGVYLLASDKLVVVAGAVAVLAPLVAFFIKRAADSSYALGERMRRLLYLEDGLGRQPSRADMLELRADSTGLPDLDPAPDGSYYSSPFNPGPRRLAHIAEEAAFHTRGYADSTARIMMSIAVCGGVVAGMLAWYGALTLPSLDDVRLLVRSAATVLTFFAAGSFVSLALSFHGLAKAAQRAFERLDRMTIEADPSSEDVLLVLAAYDCSLARTPPIPAFVYWAIRGRLNRAWREHGNTEG